MAKQWWALAVTTAMALSSGAAIAAGSNTYGTPSSTNRTSGTDLNPNTNDTSKPIDDSTDVDRTNQSGVDDTTDQMGDRLNQSGDEVGAKLDSAEMKFTDLKEDQVKKIQQKLTDDGFYKGPINGHFGPKTKAALKEFADSKGMELKGDVMNSKLASEFQINSDIQPVKGDSSTKDEGTKSGTDTKTQSGTDSGAIDTGAVPDASSSPSTQNTDTQKQSGVDSSTSSGSSMGGMNTTGRTDNGVSGSTSTSSTDIENQRGSDTSVATNTEMIRQAQLALKDKGLLKTEPSGTLDNDTKSALKAFQKENKLPVTGKLDSKTLAKLGVNTAPNSTDTINKDVNNPTGSLNPNPSASPTMGTDSTTTNPH